MEVLALVGPSGTGKSHRALLVAHNNQADAIIDDSEILNMLVYRRQYSFYKKRRLK